MDTHTYIRQRQLECLISSGGSGGYKRNRLAGWIGKKKIPKGSRAAPRTE